MKKIISLVLALSLVITACLAITPKAAELVGDKSNWKVSTTSEVSWGIIEKAFDGDTKTYWHSNYKAQGSTILSHDEAPFEITVVLPAATAVTGFIYTPRLDSNTGRMQEFEIYISADDTTAPALIMKGTGDGTTDPKTYDFGKVVTAKKIILKITKGISGYGSMAEFDLIKASSSQPAASQEASAAQSSEPKKLANKSKWQLSANSEISYGLIEKAFDDNTSTYWHSNYKAQGSTILSHDEAPFEITVILPAATAVTGFIYTPRLDSNTGRMQEFEIYISADDTTAPALIMKGTGDGTTDPKTYDFGKVVTAKKIILKITKGISGYGSMAEFDLLSGGALKTEEPAALDPLKDTSKWKITSSSEMDSWGSITKAFDGDKSTFWHTHYTAEGSTITGRDSGPYTVDIVLPEKTEISGFTIVNRNNTTGIISKLDFYVAPDDESQPYLLYSGSFDTSTNDKVCDFTCNVAVKHIRLYIKESSQGYAVMAEFQLMPKNEKELTVPYEKFAEQMAENKLYQVDPSNITASCDLGVWSGHESYMMLDNSSSTFWQTDESFTDILLKVDLGDVYTLDGFKYLPRQTTDYNGAWITYNMWVSTDGVKFDPLYENAAMARSLDEKYVKFDKPTAMRYIEFTITKCGANRAGCAELTFWQNKAGYDDYNAKKGGKFVLQIGSKNMEVTKEGKTYTKPLDVAPYISGGYTLIPLRGILEEMGANIEWVDKSQTINITKDNLKLKLQVRNKLVYASDPRYGDVTYTLYAVPRIKDSRTFVPIRFISEQLGFNVEWDGVKQTITISKE